MSHDTTLDSTPDVNAEPSTISGDAYSRRTFLSYLWLAAGTLATGEAAFLGLRYVGSRKSDSPFGEVINVGRTDDFEPGTITAFPEARFFLVRFEDGGFLALYARCTHLACMVSWEEDQGRFVCPCHGSEFDRAGDVLSTPAPRPLDRFPVVVSKRRVEVDTGNPIRRNEPDPADIAFFIEE